MENSIRMQDFFNALESYSLAVQQLRSADEARGLVGFGVKHNSPREMMAVRNVNDSQDAAQRDRAHLLTVIGELTPAEKARIKQSHAAELAELNIEL